MPADNRSIRLFLWAFLALLLGVLNYFFFRSNIILFDGFTFLQSGSVVDPGNSTARLLRNSFSDIAWCLSLCFCSLGLNRLRKLTLFERFFILSVPFMTEFGQYFFLVPGTFDLFDLLTYALVIIFFNAFFSNELIPIHMKKFTTHALSVSLAIVFFLMAFACATTQRTNYRSKPAPDPCVRHGALSYSPIKVQINIDGSYTMKDLSGAQRSGQTYFLDALKAVNPGKYVLADGVTPNLNIYITINTDSYQHYGAKVTFYVDDDNTWFSTATNYVEPYKLFDDIASKLNSFVLYGWTHGKCN